jgi:hypothetical protein
MSIDINNSKDYKKCFASSFSLTDNDGRNYPFVRSFNQKRKGWFNIAKCEIIAKDKSVPKGYAGIIPDAVWFSDEQVADLVAQVEERAERLERAEVALREWIAFRQAWSRKPNKKGKLRLAKKEV